MVYSVDFIVDNRFYCNNIILGTNVDHELLIYRSFANFTFLFDVFQIRIVHTRLTGEIQNGHH